MKPVIEKEFMKKLNALSNKYQIPLDLIDAESIYDIKLSEEENLRIFTDYISQMAGAKHGIEKKAEMEKKKGSVRHEKELIEKTNLENLKKEEEKSQQEFEMSLKEIEGNSKILDKRYYIPSEYVKVITSQNNSMRSLLLLGGQGLGKSFNVLKTLNETKKKYVYKSGFITPMALYIFLYHHGREENTTIVFDDTAGIMNGAGTSILLSALYSSSEAREVSWNSTSQILNKMNVPTKFIFKANMILITNKLPNNLSADLIKSRCLVYEFNFSNKEVLTIMKAISQTKHPTLTKAEREEVFNYIYENVSEGTKDFDLRVQMKIESLYSYGKNWKELAKPLINNVDEDIILVKHLLKECSSMFDVEKKWKEQTNKSRATLFRVKAKLI